MNNENHKTAAPLHQVVGPHLYDVIITDPPWSYYGDQSKMGACGKEYKTMTDAEIARYKYPLSPHGILFMWATCPRLDFAMECIKAHGLSFRGVAFVWVKTRADGEIMGACGVRPSIIKPTTELVLAASRVKTGRPLPLLDESIRQVIAEPRRGHSVKPKIHHYIERMYATKNRAEFFAREHVCGWDCFGDELPPNAEITGG